MQLEAGIGAEKGAGPALRVGCGGRGRLVEVTSSGPLHLRGHGTLDASGAVAGLRSRRRWHAARADESAAQAARPRRWSYDAAATAAAASLPRWHRTEHRVSVQATTTAGRLPVPVEAGLAPHGSDASRRPVRSATGYGGRCWEPIGTLASGRWLSREVVVIAAVVSRGRRRRRTTRLERRKRLVLRGHAASRSRSRSRLARSRDFGLLGRAVEG